MEKKDVKVRVVGTQVDETGEVNTIELMTEGKFYKKGNADYIVYEETEISGMEGITTSLKIEHQRVSMVRFGSSSSNMVFDKSEEHKLSYPTPYGEIDMVIETESIDVAIKEAVLGSKVSLDYSLTVVQNMATSRNKLDITIVR